MVVRLRASSISRSVVRLLIALFVLFGATFIPPKITYSTAATPATTATLQGFQAGAYVQSRMAKDERFRRAMEKVREKPGVHLAGQIVHVTQMQTNRPASMTLLGLLGGYITAHAEQVTEYVEGGVVVFTPFEADSDDGSAEFNVYSQESETGYARSADVKVWTYEAAYGNPDVAVEVWNEQLECESESSAIASVASWFAPALQAQTSHRGMDCYDYAAQKGVMWDRVKEAIKDGLLAAGAASFGCIWTTIGYLTCIGGAFIGGAAVSIGMETAEFIWNCRCPLFGWSCPNDDEPPPV